MEEVMKLLGPWPILQLLFGIGVLGFGVFMIVRGLQKKDEVLRIEDMFAERRAYEQLQEIRDNSFKMVELLSRILDRLNNNADQMKALSAAIWNKREGF